MATPFKVVAFDCDGVMFDTEKANKAFYNRILNHLGMPDMTAEQFAYANMHTADKVLAYLFPDPVMYATAQSCRGRMGYQPFIEHMQMEPHLKPLLRRLRPHYHTAVATNRSDSIAMVIDTFDLADDFDYVVNSLDVAHPKPAPDLLLKIISHFRVTPDQVLYVGDSELDQLAARAAGVFLAAFGNPHLDADFHIGNLKELESILSV